MKISLGRRLTQCTTSDHSSDAMISLFDRRTVMIGSLCAAALFRPARAIPSVVIRLPVASDGPPISELDASGHYVGMIESSLAAITSELGWQIVYSTMPWKRAQEYVHQGKLDALCTVPSERRREYVLFAANAQFEIDGNWIYFAADNPRADEIRNIRSIDQLKTFQIAIERGNAWPNDLMRDGWQTTEVENIDLVTPMLRSHRVDLAFEVPTFDEIANRGKQMPKIERMRLELLPGGYTPYTFGLRRDFPNAEQLIAAFDVVHKRLIASGAMDRVLAPFGHPPPSKKKPAN